MFHSAPEKLLIFSYDYYSILSTVYFRKIFFWSWPSDAYIFVQSQITTRLFLRIRDMQVLRNS